MPIEIRELIIKVSVDQHNKSSNVSMDNKELAALKSKIIKECVEAVRLRMKNISQR
jgi:hypothetical protein